MHRRGLTPFAEFLELNLALHFFLVFGAPIVNALALGALQFDKPILRHGREYTRETLLAQYYNCVAPGQKLKPKFLPA